MRKSLVSYTGILSTLFVLATMLLDASCTQQDEYTSAVGYLYAPTLDMNLTVEDLQETRADGETVTLPNVPTDASGVTFVVKDKDGTKKYNDVGLWTKPLVLPVGSYTITATYGTNTFGAPHFVGSASGTIEALKQVKPSPIQMTLGNALVRVQLDTELKKHFTPKTLSFSQGTEKASYEYKEDQWYYIPSSNDEKISLSLSGTNEAEVDATFNYDITTPAAKTAYAITCNQNTSNWPTITLEGQQDGAWAGRLYVNPATVENVSDANKTTIYYEVSTSEADWTNAIRSEHVEGDHHVVNELTNGASYYVRARIGNIFSNIVGPFTVKERLTTNSEVNIAHTYSDNVLTGSSATLDLGFDALPDDNFLKKIYKDGILKVSTSLTKDGKEVRTSSTPSGTMGHSGWPYIPQGNYVLTINHSLKPNTKESTTATSTLSGFNSPAPTLFTTKFGASYTSYDKGVGNDDYGISKDVNFANNNCNSETIYGVSVSGVSADLMNNTNYTGSSVTIGLYYNDSGTASKTYNKLEVGEINGLTDWGKYTLKAAITFDGETKEATNKTHHITGLPYTAAPPTNSGTHPWTSNNDAVGAEIEFNADNVKMTTSSTPPYIVSPTFYIPADIDVSMSSSAQVNALYWFFSWQTTNYTAKIGGNTVFSQASDKQTGKTFNPSGTGTFTRSNNTVTLASTYNALGPNIIIYNVAILYR